MALVMDFFRPQSPQIALCERADSLYACPFVKSKDFTKKNSPFPGAPAEQWGKDGCEKSVGFTALLLAQVGHLPRMLPVSNGFWHITSV